MNNKKINSAKRMSEDTLSSLLEELNQVANGPEIDDAAGKLDNEATEGKAPVEDTLEKSNADIYPKDEHEQTEDVEEVVVESDQVAASPDVEQAPAELNNEATEEKQPEKDTLEKENSDVYCDDCHDQAEDVKEVVSESSKYTDDQLFKLLEAKGFKKTEKNLRIVKEGLDSGRFAITEDGLETEPMVKAAEDAGVASDSPAKDAETTIDEIQDIIDTDIPVEPEHIEDDSVNESMARLFSLIDTINENAQLAAGSDVEQAPAELDNEATEEKKPEEDTLEKENSDVYCDDCHDQAEDVKEVVIEQQINKSGMRHTTTPEQRVAKRAQETVSTVTKADGTKKYEYRGVGYDTADEAEKARTKYINGVRGLKQVTTESAQVANGPDVDKRPEELDNEATEGKAPVEDTLEKKNSDVYCDNCHDQTEDVEEVVVESDQVAAGPDVEQAPAELDNEATEEKAPIEDTLEKKNSDVYCDFSHKQVEDLVDVVVEAVRYCKIKNIPVSSANITDRTCKLLEDMGAKVGDPSDKEYDVDADIESSEMNGSDTAFDSYDEIKDDNNVDSPEAEKMQETVQYSSLKEACMLDEGYFKNDTYTIQHADEKVQKLTEQVALLAAREAMDPMYDELLKEALYCQRLQEALQNKYANAATARVNAIISD